MALPLRVLLCGILTCARHAVAARLRPRPVERAEASAGDKTHNFCNDAKGTKFEDEYKKIPFVCGDYKVQITKHLSYGYQGITVIANIQKEGLTEATTALLKVDKRPAASTWKSPSNMRHECKLLRRLKRANVSVPACFGVCEFAGHEMMLMAFVEGAMNVDTFYDTRKYPHKPKSQQILRGCVGTKCSEDEDDVIPPPPEEDEVGKRASREMITNLYRMLGAGVVNHDQFWRNILVQDNGHVTFIDMGFATTKKQFKNGTSPVSRVPGLSFRKLQRLTISSVLGSISRKYLKDAFDSTFTELERAPGELSKEAAKEVETYVESHISWRKRWSGFHKMWKKTRRLAHELGGPDGALSFLFLEC